MWLGAATARPPTASDTLGQAPPGEFPTCRLRRGQGQAHGKRALEVAAAGGHNILTMLWQDPLLRVRLFKLSCSKGYGYEERGLSVRGAY
jgi:hypothetical protein